MDVYVCVCERLPRNAARVVCTLRYFLVVALLLLLFWLRFFLSATTDNLLRGVVFLRSVAGAGYPLVAGFMSSHRCPYDGSRLQNCQVRTAD